MNLTSLSFIGIYFPLLLVFYYNPFFRKNGFRKLLLIGASLGLYAFCEPIYVLLLVSMIIVNYIFVCLSDRFITKIFRGMAIIIDCSYKHGITIITLPLFGVLFTFL